MIQGGRREALARSLERVLEMVRKEFHQVFRDPRMRRVILVSPMVQLLAFGYAVSTDLRHATTFVVDHDRTAESRALVDALTAGGTFRIVGRSERSGDLTAALDRGRALMGVEIPVGFARALGGSRPAQVQLVFDGTSSNMASIARGYAERIVASYGARAVPGESPPIELRERAWFNPALTSRNYNVPAVIGQLILLVCLLLTSLAVVREREVGTLEQLMVSPLTPLELIAGKTIPFALIGLLDLVLVTAVALLWFHIPFHGNPLLLLAASVLFLLSGLGIGLLISTQAATQQEAFMTTFLVFMPTTLLSGFMFPVSSMPTVFQWITLANPLRHYLVIVRGVFLKGVGLGALWPEFLALLAIGASLLGFAATRFRKTVV